MFLLQLMKYLSMMNIITICDVSFEFCFVAVNNYKSATQTGRLTAFTGAISCDYCASCV